jgi:hypothetical protein
MVKLIAKRPQLQNVIRVDARQQEMASRPQALLKKYRLKISAPGNIVATDLSFSFLIET